MYKYTQMYICDLKMKKKQNPNSKCMGPLWIPGQYLQSLENNQLSLN